MTLPFVAAAVAMLIMRDPYQKLHFVTPAALMALVLVTLAVLVRMGLSENTGEMSQCGGNYRKGRPMPSPYRIQ